MTKVAYIVVHGFGGSPKDVRTIKEQLKLKNINEEDIFTPLLLGHDGKGVINLKIRFEEIVLDLKKYLEENCGNYEKIVLVGYSMGGLIVMALALETKIDVLVLVNAPMDIWVFKNFMWTVYSVKDLHRKVYHVKIVLSSINYKKIINNFELRRLQKYIKANLSKITSNTYIIQSEHDYVAKPMSAYEIYDNIGAKEKEIRWHKYTSHFIPDEEYVEEIMEDVLKWTSNILQK